MNQYPINQYRGATELLVALIFACGCAYASDENDSERISGSSFFEFFRNTAPKTERAISIDDLVAIRDIRSHAVSPDGRYVVLQVTQGDPEANAHRGGWYIVPTKRGSEPRFVDDAGPSRMMRVGHGYPHGALLGWPVAWSPDGQQLAYLKEVNGAVQIWRAPVDSSMPEQVTRNAADVIDFTWAPDGSFLFFVVGLDRDFMTNASTEEAARGVLFDDRIEPRFGATPFWAPCEPRDIRNLYLESLESNVERCEPVAWVFEMKSGEERRATDSEASLYWDRQRVHNSLDTQQSSNVTSLIWSPNGESLAWLENLDPEKYVGRRPPLTVSAARAESRQEPIRCPDEMCTGVISRLWWRHETGEVIFQGMESDGLGFRLGGHTGNTPTVNILYGWTPGEKTVRRILRTDDSFRNCDIAKDRLICLYGTWTRPDRIATINLDNGSVQIVFDPNPDFGNFAFTEIDKIEVSNPQGNRMTGHLVYPAGYDDERSYPLVAVNTSCVNNPSAFLRGGSGDEIPIHVLAQHGFAVLCYTPSGASFDSARPLLEKMIGQLDARGIVDSARVGISGLSSGAAMVDDAIVNSSIPFAAAQAAWSNSHPVSYYLLYYSSARAGYRKRAGGDPFSGGLEYWSKMSPGIHAREVNTPLLLQVADVEASHALPNYMSLKDAGKPVEMYLFPNEYHIKWQPAHKYAVYKRNLQWFKFWLQGVEEPDPLDPEQYIRWRAMRESHCANLKDEGAGGLPVYCELVN